MRYKWSKTIKRNPSDERVDKDGFHLVSGFMGDDYDVDENEGDGVDDDDGVDEKPLSMEGHSSPLPINQELAKDLRKVFEVIMMKMMMISIMFMTMMMIY